MLDENRYAELLREKRPRVIRTAADNESAQREIAALKSRLEAASAEEAEYLALIVALVEHYENGQAALLRTTRREVLCEPAASHGVRRGAIVALFAFERRKPRLASSNPSSVTPHSLAG